MDAEGLNGASDELLMTGVTMLWGLHIEGRIRLDDWDRSMVMTIILNESHENHALSHRVREYIMDLVVEYSRWFVTPVPPSEEKRVQGRWRK